MAENSKIEWTDHTVNFWWGCLKVSPGCTHCYAETLSKRTGRNIWGPAATTERWRTTGPWRDILKWEKAAAAEGVRKRVFAQSMSDFFEDHPQLESWRAEACAILEGLQWLDIQLLTKRPENIARMVPVHWMEHWPQHIWIGTSVENQEMADKRIPELLKIPAAIRFLSIEPLLGPVDLRRIVKHGMPIATDSLTGGWSVPHNFEGKHRQEPRIHWVIVGGESGPNARPTNPAWVRLLRDQCQDSGVAYFFKQWGEYVPEAYETVVASFSENEEMLQPWPMVRVGKKVAGRLLDGREWNEFPGTFPIVHIADNPLDQTRRAACGAYFSGDRYVTPRVAASIVEFGESKLSKIKAEQLCPACIEATAHLLLEIQQMNREEAREKHVQNMNDLAGFWPGRPDLTDGVDRFEQYPIAGGEGNE